MKNKINKILLIFSVCLASEINFNLDFIKKINSVNLNDEGLSYGLILNSFYYNKKFDNSRSLRIYGVSSFVEKDFNLENKLYFFVKSSWYVLFVNHKISNDTKYTYISPFVFSVSCGAKYNVISNLSLKFEFEHFLNMPNDLSVSLSRSRNFLSLSLNFEF